jgi:uncharacterized protein (DUF1778 family)
MSEKRYPATPEQLKALSIMWVKKHRDVRFQFRVTEKEAELIRRGFAKVGITMTDYLRGAVLDYSKTILGNLSDRAEDRI